MKYKTITVTNIKHCKEFNPIEHWDVFNKMINDKTNKFLKLIDNKTVQLNSKKYLNCYVIVHKSTKKANTIQLTRFKNHIPYSDSEYSNYFNAIKENGLYQYEIKEVV